MKVKELIEILSKLEQEFIINSNCCEQYGICKEVEIYKIKNKNEYVLKHDEILKCEEDYFEEIK